MKFKAGDRIRVVNKESIGREYRGLTGQIISVNKKPFEGLVGTYKISLDKYPGKHSSADDNDMELDISLIKAYFNQLKDKLL